MAQPYLKSVCVLLLFFYGLAQGWADNGWEGQILSLGWENDATVGSDRHYTQGARISYLSRDNALPHWLERFSSRVPTLGLQVEAQKFGLALGQEIYTPEDLRNPKLIVNDRPYAGWLFGTAALQRRGKVSSAWSAMETLSLDLGIIGREALAAETQKEWHGVSPKGWKNQLRSEPGLVLRYDRRYLVSTKSESCHWSVDLIPSFGASAGNVATFFAAGSLTRFGYNIPNEFEPRRENNVLKYGAYLFGGVEARAVLRNIFLDGNSFRVSHHVKKEPFVADFKAGLTVVLKAVELTAAHTLRTHEFQGQNHDDSFSSATLTIKF